MTVTIIVIVVLAWSAGYWQGRARRPADLEAPTQHVVINNGPVYQESPRRVLIDEHGRYWQLHSETRATYLGRPTVEYTRGSVRAELVSDVCCCEFCSRGEPHRLDI